ncbi:hypothetical protein P7K49_024801 [Saguinus oedipus]|uniref:Uncharacterized protein n=1 Tax=Saguinus oedipus TaxID=9490 RepID=A0ABQ9UQJ6_SAGOE|nr:hypothetical protein P7K49_024801 [Saguinus oedipus]
MEPRLKLWARNLVVVTVPVCPHEHPPQGSAEPVCPSVRCEKGSPVLGEAQGPWAMSVHSCELRLVSSAQSSRSSSACFHPTASEAQLCPQHLSENLPTVLVVVLVLLAVAVVTLVGGVVFCKARSRVQSR